VTRHIGTDAQVHLGGWLEVKVWKKICDAVQSVQRNLRSFRQRLQLLSRQVPVLALDRSKIVEDQTPSGPVIA